MSWFRREKSWEERFPADRLASLLTALQLTLILSARKNGYDPDTVLRTRWVNGYLLGLPQVLDDADAKFCGAIRKAIFQSLHGDSSDVYFRKCLSYLDVEDEQTERGFGAGVPDGQRCFEAIESGQSLEGCFSSLEAFFEMKSVDSEALIQPD
jgi:hypothetical protein